MKGARSGSKEGDSGGWLDLLRLLTFGAVLCIAVLGVSRVWSRELPVSAAQNTSGQTPVDGVTGTFYTTPLTDTYLTDASKSITVTSTVSGSIGQRVNATWFSAPPANTFYSGFTTAVPAGGAIDVNAQGCTVTPTVTTTCTNVGTWTLTFSKPVTNPVLYLSGIGNLYSGRGTTGAGNFGIATRLNLTSAQLNGSGTTATLSLVGAGDAITPANPINMTVTASQIRDTTVVVGNSCTTAPLVGCGAVRITGTVTRVTFTADMQTTSASGGPSGTISSYTGDGISFAVAVDEDYGDAPSTFDQPAAAHVIGSLKLGNAVTAENVNVNNNGTVAASPLASATATNDSDDGVTMPASMRQTSNYSIPVSVNGTGLLSAWFDWNRNGVFDSGEQAVAGQSVTTGTTNISVTVPAGASLGTSYARFRLTTLSGLAANGPAPDGEVEDYAFTIASAPLTTGTAVTMNQCPVAPTRVQGTLAGWFNNWPGSTLTQDGYYNESWSQLSWQNNGIGADTARLAGQGSSQSFGPGVSQSNAPLATLRNLKPVTGTWASQGATLSDAIANGLYVQFNVTTSSSYEAGRMVLWGGQNFNNLGGTWRTAMFISTSSTFTTSTELYRDASSGTQENIATVRPVLAKGTTYYFRLYFYNVTANTSGDGSIAWDDFNLLSGYCANVDAINDSGSAAAGAASTPIANVAANDLVNGSAATLGAAGNATIATSGTWPAGITLNTSTGAVSVTNAVAGGSYVLTYQLCDKATTPVCDTATVTVNVASPLQVQKLSVVLSDPIRGTTNPLAVPGATMRYCIVVTNAAGNEIAQNASVVDDLNALNVTYVAPTLRVGGAVSGSDCDFTTGSPGGSYSAGIIAATIASIPAGSSQTVWFDVLVN